MRLDEIIRIKSEDFEMYRLHFAKKSNETEPFDVYLRSFDEWTSWHTYRSGERDRFPVPVKYIISFMSFYEEAGTSLFGGIFEIQARDYERDDCYIIRLLPDYSYLIGTLKIRTPNTGKATVCKPSTHFDDIEVVELLPKPYKSRQ